MSDPVFRVSLNSQVMHEINLLAPVAYGAARMSYGNTEYWSGHSDYIPMRGEIVVYSDRTTRDNVRYPGIKIGDGKAYAVDLPFIDEENNDLILGILDGHLNNREIHLVPGERNIWNNKISCSIDGERLILEGADYDNG